MFSKENLRFLDDLAENNNREWFLANKKRYETMKSEYHNLVNDLLLEMKPLDSKLNHLEVKNCVFRINRDVRFSKDKSPYKTHLGIWLSSGQKGIHRSGYYVHIENNNSFIAGGCYTPEASDLNKIRKEICFFYEDLNSILENKSLKKVFGTFEKTNTNSLKNPPRGYEKDHKAIEFIKLKSFILSHRLETKDIHEKNFVSEIAKKLILLKPLNDFFDRGLCTE